MAGDTNSMEYLVRERYMKKIRAGRDDCDVIKVITGVRRCGKSVLMRMYLQELKDSGVDDDHLLYIDFDSFEGRGIKVAEDLDAILLERIPEEGIFYVPFDEIQNVRGWEMTLASLNSYGRCDVYITGSNSDMLSSDLATHISGRHTEIRVMPFSLKEFVMKNGYSDLDRATKDYMYYGGLPGLDISRGEEYCTDYLNGVFNTVIVKDVMRHQGVTDLEKMVSIAHFIQSNIGNITNNDTIAMELGLASTTVSRYILAMRDALLFYRCPRYDMVGKKLLKTNGKYYVTDLGMRNAELGMPAGADMGHSLENIVFLELLRRGYDVRVGSFLDSEIDFMARKSGDIQYFQISLTMLSEETMDRELRPFNHVRDNYAKTVLTLDRFGLGDRNGIKIVNVIDWLMDTEI